MIISSKSATNPANIQPSEITSQDVYINRRKFILAAGFGFAAGSSLLLSNKVRAANISGGTTEGAGRLIGRANAPATEKGADKSVLTGKTRQKINGYTKTSYGAGEKLTKYEDVTTYNNY
jgi:sulfoxide reductase catalytic subunit YedY